MINKVEYEVVDAKIEGPPYTEYWKIVSVKDRSKFFWYEKFSLDEKLKDNKEDNKHLIYEM
jgi:hypothetical protein